MSIPNKRTKKAKAEPYTEGDAGREILQAATWLAIHSSQMQEHLRHISGYADCVFHEMHGSKAASGAAYVHTNTMVKLAYDLKRLLEASTGEIDTIMSRVRAWEEAARDRQESKRPPPSAGPSPSRTSGSPLASASPPSSRSPKVAGCSASTSSTRPSRPATSTPRLTRSGPAARTSARSSPPPKSRRGRSTRRPRKPSPPRSTHEQRPETR